VWSSYNYPTSISAVDATGNEAATFQYGPDRQRWQYVYNGPSGTKTYYYVGEDLEVAFIAGETYYRHYIYAGSKPVAVYIRNSDAGITMSYLSMDHEGSVSAITLNNGTVGADESFAAFGARRNSSTWSGPPTSANMSAIVNYTRQGYTFQTWLGESMGLNHMNGRVQDAILGRMISPDPHITDPTNAQGYNRYSYVNNNPLTEVDPTGFVNKPYEAASGEAMGGGGWYSGTYDPNTGITTVSYGSPSSGGSSNGPGGGSICYVCAPPPPSTGRNAPPTPPPSNGDAGQAQSQVPYYLNPNPSDEENASQQAQAGLSYGPLSIGQFGCGSTTCTYNMNTFSNPAYGQNGVNIQVGLSGDAGGAWVQTYVRNGVQAYDVGAGSSNSLYPGYGSTSNLFVDSPSMTMGTSGTFNAQTTYVVPNSTGGYNAVFTFSWGFQQSSGGISFTTPSITSPNALQSSAIATAFQQ
jgi:RHS repeat-associated protein